MKKSSHSLIYDSIGIGYQRFRIPDHRIASQIREAIGNASSVCNIGAGAGSYEPSDLQVTPVEPSQRMIDQRADSKHVVRANAEELPFEDEQFDVAMAVLTVHHWTDPMKGLAEMRRVSRRQVILTFDPFKVDSFWLVRDYLPEFAELDKKQALSIEAYRQSLSNCTVHPVMVPWDCTDGFLAAYWRRPEMYLDPAARNAISSFSKVDIDYVTRAISQLEIDIATGAWNQRYSDLLERDEMDYGYRIVVACN